MGDQAGSASSILAAAEEHDTFGSSAPRGIVADAWKRSAEGSEARVESTVARWGVGSFPQSVADASDARTSVGCGSRGGLRGRRSAAADLSCSIGSTVRLSTSSSTIRPSRSSASSKEPRCPLAQDSLPLSSLDSAARDWICSSFAGIAGIAGQGPSDIRLLVWCQRSFWTNSVYPESFDSAHPEPVEG